MIFLTAAIHAVIIRCKFMNAYKNWYFAKAICIQNKFVKKTGKSGIAL